MNQDDKSKFLECIAEQACKYFSDKLPKGGKPCTDKEWTTMAAIVQSNINQQDIQVVSLGTGTKCIGKNELSPLGDVLSDSHAEVVCRRSFLLYLYDQLFLKLANKTSIFELNENEHTFTLRPSTTFHLFISHVPCGDAAIVNSPIESNTNDDDTTETPTKKSKMTDSVNNNDDVVSSQRTGAKLSVGVETYEDVQIPGKCRVKPGKGDPTISMSCSDKIAKWQIMGLQGSLLGNFIKTPIVFQSIVIGSSVPFELTSVKRAIYDRFRNETLNGILLQSPFKLEHCSPEIYQSRTNFLNFSAPRQVSKPAPSSISSYKMESINKYIVDVSVNGRKQGATKKNFGKPIAQVPICRRNLFEICIKMYSKYEMKFKTGVLALAPSTKLTYKEAKKVNSAYNETWNSIKNQVMIGWTTKPENLQDFCLST